MKIQDIKKLDVNKITNEIIDTISSHYEKEIDKLKTEVAEKDKEIITLDCVISEIHSDLKELQEFKVGDDKYDLTDSDARFSLECELLNKDKEIKKLNFMIETLPNHDTEIEQQIRHQVCEEIREKLQMNKYNTCENTAFGVHYDYLKEILDQIEEGENNGQ